MRPVGAAEGVVRGARFVVEVWSVDLLDLFWLVGFVELEGGSCTESCSADVSQRPTGRDCYV